MFETQTLMQGDTGGVWKRDACKSVAKPLLLQHVEQSDI